MIVLENGGYPAGGPGTALALGYFDGVHLGHTRVIGAAAAYAKEHALDPAVFTFTIGQDGHKGKRLLTEGQKRVALEVLGVAYCFEPPFDSFKHLTPDTFFEQLILSRFHAKAVFCGEDYRFGAQRAGDAQTLRALCAGHGVYFEMAGIAFYDGAPVSTSRIKAALAAGDIDTANAMLGRRLF